MPCAWPTNSREPAKMASRWVRPCTDLLDLANETLAGDSQAGEHARGMAMHMAEQLAAVEGLAGAEAHQLLTKS